MTTDSTHKKHSLPFVIFLVVTALVCGALVMVIEVLGSRVIGPIFGESIFIWTSLITVTLVGLAMGYAVGGVLSDRRGSAAYLYGIIFMAGMTVHLIPFLKRPVFEFTIPLGLRFGALSASSLLFGLPLFLLGCVSPYIIKIAAREMHNIGKTVGLFYAVSTVGSFVGTVCTGFILIAYFRVNQIFAFIGWSLMILAVLYFVFFRKNRFSFVLLALPLLLPMPRDVMSMDLGNGTVVTKIYEADTFYGNIKVLDYNYPDMRVRELLLDSAVQGGIDLSNGMPVYGYYYYLQYIPYSLNPAGKSCLVMGLGTGIIPMWYEKMGIRTDVIEINPGIVNVAEKYFGFHTSGEKIVEDARYFLNRTEKKYDYMILDVFNGESMPEHVLSHESLQLISQRLNARGILGMNVVGSVMKDTFVMSSIIKTLHEIFSTVEIFPTFVPGEGNQGIGNLEIFAYNFPPVALDRERLQRFEYHPYASSVRYQIGKKFTFPPGTPGIILNDNYNPIDYLEPRVKEEVRNRVLNWTNRELLL